VASPTDPPVAAGQSAVPGSLDASTAIALAGPWLASQDQAAYTVDPGTCVASQLGVNWSVSCQGQLLGCRSSACSQWLSACVLDQPRLVAASC
jgi:hypothetical protein